MHLLANPSKSHSEVNHYKYDNCRTYCSLVVMLGILALGVSQDLQRTKDQQKSFDERIIHFITIKENFLEFVVCSLTFLIDYPQNLTKADILGEGNLNLVSE